MPYEKTSKALKAGRKSNWLASLALAGLTIASLVVGRAYGKVGGRSLDPKIVAWTSAGVVLIAGIVAATRLSRELSRLATHGSPTAGAPVRLVSAGLGYVLVLFAFLAVLEVQAGRLLVGAGVLGVVLGIAGQQSLGNVFAGLVLLLARPFEIGDYVRIRSGALGGIFDGRIMEMSLTYVTLRVEDLPLKIPNSAMLAAGVARLPGPPAAAPPAPAVPATPTATVPAPTATVPAATAANDPSAPPGAGPQ